MPQKPSKVKVSKETWLTVSHATKKPSKVRTRRFHEI